MPAPNFVSGVAGALAGGATYVLPAMTLVAGNAVLVFGRLNNLAFSVTGITDQAGNTYTAVNAKHNGGSLIACWQANNVIARVNNVITVAFSGADSFPEFGAIQVTDQNTLGFVEAAIYTAPALVPGYVNVENTLVVMCGEVSATGGTWTPSAGFTKGAEGSDNVIVMAYRQITTLTAITPSLTQSNPAGRQMFTVLLPAEAGGGGGGGGANERVILGGY